MNRTRNLIVIAIAVLGIIFLRSSAFIVNETEQAIVTQFGKPVGSPITKPGIQFKLPLIQETHFFEK